MSFQQLFEQEDLNNIIVGSIITQFYVNKQSGFSMWMVLDHDIKGDNKNLRGKLTEDITRARNLQDKDHLIPLYQPSIIFYNPRSGSSGEIAKYLKEHFSNNPETRHYSSFKKEVARLKKAKDAGVSVMFVVSEDVYFSTKQRMSPKNKIENPDPLLQIIKDAELQEKRILNLTDYNLPESDIQFEVPVIEISVESPDGVELGNANL